MSVTVRKVNEFLKTATKAQVNDILEKIILSERQSKVFNMFYIKQNDIGFIADTLYISRTVINQELKIIRDKVLVVL